MNIGIIGCGGVGNVHANSLKNIFKDDASFKLCLCDIKKNNLDSFYNKFGGVTYDSLEKMLSNEKLDALHICTPHYLHVPMAISALEVGVNVIMEKPPAITTEQLQKLIEAEEKSSARLGICFQNRYNNSSVLMKKLIQSNEYGNVIGARAFVTWHRTPEYYTQSDWRGSLETEGGGVLTNQSIHTIDLLNFFLGKPISVEGTVSNHLLKDVIEVEDTAEALIKYKDFNACYYATTSHCSDSSVFIEIALEKMTFRIDGEYFFYIQNNKIIKMIDLSDKDNVINSNILSKSYWGNSHQILISDYYNKLANNLDFDVTINNCQDAIKLVWGIYNSSKLKCEITL